MTTKRKSYTHKTTTKYNMAKKSKSLGKFIIAFDTICDGWETGEGEDGKPVLYNSHNEAVKEIFDTNHSMLSNRSVSELKEYNKGVTKRLVKIMGKILEQGDIKQMEDFMKKHPECDDSGEFVVEVDKFVKNRKLVFGKEGFKIIGTKL